MNNKILVTGAAGFTGKEVVRHFIAQGAQVRAMCRSEHQAAQLAALGAEPVIADLTIGESIRAAVQGINQIVHVGALFRQAGLPDSAYRAVNVEGTRCLLDNAIKAGVSRFIHCSTVGVHGDVKELPATEQTDFNPGDIYQETKLEGEQLVRSYFSQGKISGVIIRPAMIYGPGDRRTFKLFKMVAKGLFFYVGSGENLVHFIDVRDLARAFWLASTRHDLSNETFIIAGERGLPLKELVSLIAFRLGRRPPKLHLPVRPMQILGSVCEALCTPLRISPPIFRRRVDFYTKHRLFSSEHARTRLGFEPSQSMYGEVTDILNSYIDSGDIRFQRLSKPAVMVRKLTGNITRWDAESRNIYGWSPESATGSISHQLLKTEFPYALDKINDELKRTKEWRGVLVHRTMSGETIRMQSRWLLTESFSSEPEILEMNWPAGSDSSRGSHADAYYSWVSAIPSALETLGGVDSFMLYAV